MTFNKKATIVIFFLTGLGLLPVFSQTNWQNIPLYAPGGGALFDYATALSRSIMFYDANFCGPNVTEINRFNWRGDCHINDGIRVTLSNGTTRWLDATGGYHDAGDHIKFGITNAYAASTLGWGFYEFRDEYEQTGQDVWLLRAVKWATDYFIRCHPEPDLFLYSVGSDADHNFWGPPELQLDSRSPRDIVIATPSTPASDVCGNTAAALALMSINYRSIDADYADLCLEHARQLYSLGRNYLGLSDGLSFYPPSIYWDDLAWGAIWLYVATGESFYLEQFNTIIGPACAGLDKDNNIANGIEWVNKWGHCWDAVWSGVFVVAAAATGEQAFIDQCTLHLDFWLYELKESPGGLKYLNEWGSLRYATATALTALAFYNNFPVKANEVYRNFGGSQMSYALGSNPMDRSYLVGLAPNSAKHPHHDAAHGSVTGFLDDPPEHRHVLYGALVGGPGLDDQHNDLTDDYVQNEVSIDFNAGCVGALAGMRRFFGDASLPAADPAGEPVVDEFYSEAYIKKDNAERTQVTTYIYNRTVHPPRFDNQLGLRYFVDLSEVFAQGYALSNINIQQVVNEQDAGTLSPAFTVWDAVHHIYYLEVSYAGQEFYNRREYQFGLIFTTPNFLGRWDSSNDFSMQGLTATLAISPNIPVYRAGQLIWGQEPYKDVTPPAVPTGLSAAAVGSFQINLDWNDVTAGDLSCYNIYRGTSAGFALSAASLIGSATASRYAATDLIAQTTYYFKVTAVDDSLNESAASAEAFARTLIPDSMPPAAPTGLRVTSSRAEELSLSWQQNGEADLSGYRVYRSRSSGFIPGSSNLIGASLTNSYIDMGLTPLTTYYYRIMAVDTSANTSPASTQLAGTTQPPEPPALRLQYSCVNTGTSASEIRFDLFLFNEGDKDLALTDITIRYWLTSEPELSGLKGTCDYADVGHAQPTYRFVTSGSRQFAEIGFKATALVPTWLGGDGSANKLPAGGRTGEIQNRITNTSGMQVLFDQSNDWSFDSSHTSAADWNRITVHYQGQVLAWGVTPGLQPLAGDVNGSGKVDIIDALMTAQYYVGLNPEGFDASAADVNRDNRVTIVDALIMAQYYVGLIGALPV